MALIGLPKAFVIKERLHYFIRPIFMLNLGRDHSITAFPDNSGKTLKQVRNHKKNDQVERPKVEKKIDKTIQSSPQGSIYFVDDFLDYGNPESVKKALLRLKEKGILVRLAHGIYLSPKIDKELEKSL